MRYIKLLNGSKMPILGLGTWQATDKLEIIIDRALDIGYRHFDTSILYGNESILGNCLNKWINSDKISRDDLFVTTKLPPHGMYPERVGEYIDKSLINLNMRYIDLYLIHSPEGILNLPQSNDNNADFEMDRNVDHRAIWKEMEKAVESGKIRSIGLSNFNVNQIKYLLDSKIKPCVIQVEMHLRNQQNELINFCKSEDIAVVAYSPLGSPGITEYYQQHGKTIELPSILNNDTVLRIAKNYEKTPAQILLRHIIQKNCGAIPKTTNEKRLKENFDVFDFSLNEKDFNELNELDLGENGKLTNWESWTWI